jgi:hypothetical protein
VPPRLLDGEAPPPYYRCVPWADPLASSLFPVSSPLSYALTPMRVGRSDLGAWLSGVGLANSGELYHRGAGRHRRVLSAVGEMDGRMNCER